MITAAKRCDVINTSDTMSSQTLVSRCLETDAKSMREAVTCLGIILRISGLQSNLLEVQLAAQIDCGHHILKLGDNS